MSNIVLAAGGDDDYQISRSVRLRSSASAYLNRTPAGAGSRTTFTFSFWVKRGALNVDNTIFGIFPSATDYFGIGFGNTNGATDSIEIINAISNSVTLRVRTAAVLRDPSAWYHIVISVDTAQATAANRCIIYVNGVAQTALTHAIYPSQNANIGGWNTATAHHIGAARPNYSNYFDGYLTEVNFVDGQNLTPSSFGQTDPVTGVWGAKKYAGTYGTNGFYLNFSDPSAATAAAIGKDSSGSGNNWTPNNISVTAGATYDSMIDVPTMWADGGNGRGNYCVISPVDQTLTAQADGNLRVTTNNGGYGGSAKGSIAVSSGKWYWEWSIISNGGSAGQAPTCGITRTTNSVSSVNSSSTSYAYYGFNGNKMNAGSSSAYGASFTTSDVIGVAFDADGGTLTFYKNGTSQGTAFTGLSGEFCPVVWDPSTGGSIWVNFGQRPFAYTPPTGFKALNTQNLPESTIRAGNKFFDATLYTGNGGTQSIVNSGAMQPDLVWAKSRGSVQNNSLFDSVRGVGNYLWSNLTNAETNSSSALTAFNSNGFSLGSSSDVNQSATSFVGWQWKGGGAAVTNTSGTITSTVSAGATQGFSVATFTTPSSFTNATVGHGLGVAPKMIIVKRRTTGDWITWHTSLGTNGYVTLNTTSASSSNSGSFNGTSSTTWTLGSNAWWQASASDWVAYCFAEVAGFSRFGSYTGNGSTDGPFVYCGFRPRWIMFKATGEAGSWTIIDTARLGYNANNSTLYADTSNGEQGYLPADILSNGFKIRLLSTGTSFNTSGIGYIYAAFAENPFKNSLAR